jgi:GT2 family glycosyltransferase
LSKIGIITVVTNEKHNLKNFYTSVSSQTFKNFTVYFVDNKSTDGSPEYFMELNSNNAVNVKYITLEHNSGFSAGSNAGAEAAINDGCEFLFISNNDLVYDKNAIGEMLALIESDPKIACAGPLLMRHSQREHDIVQEFGGKINFKLGKLEKYYSNSNIKEINLPETLETDFIGGGVCFTRAEVFKKIGMYETTYFGYFDEIDLAYRLKVLNDYKMAVTSKAVIWHNHEWTKKNNFSYYFEYYLSERNKFLYYRKFGFYGSMILMLIIDTIKFPWRLIWFVKVCDFKLGIYYIRGMIAGLLNKKGKPKILTA